MTPDDRWLPWVRRTVWAVFLAGLLGFLLVGSDEPADPTLGPPAGTVQP